jgi:DNA repair protein RadA/Sms
LQESSREGAEREKMSGEKIKLLEQGAGELSDFDTVTARPHSRMKTGMDEFDRVLGGGVVHGSLILMGGDPGIGKSTLCLQVAALIARNIQEGECVLYVSLEESLEQVKMRLSRVGGAAKGLRYLGNAESRAIIGAIMKHKPRFVVVDSIQTVKSRDISSEAGSVAQIRACTVQFLECAKQCGIPILITGHVTKEGYVAGPKMLEHLVDAVMYLEGDETHLYRLLRAVKNRFGSLHEVGVFEMREKGLVPVANPSQLFLEQHTAALTGSCVSVVVEGVRPFLIEIQALVTRTNFGYPKRTAAGIDVNRIQLLIAILNKRAGVNLGMHDVYINVVGGYKAREPSVDLAVAAALLSAYKDVSLGKIVCIGEIGLGGEVRAVPHIERRVKEAQNLGFSKIYLPFSLLAEAGESAKSGEFIGVSSVKELEQHIV